ncbi:leucine-rich repeat and transmembrane domain-containing protein 2-like [Copidosoma floridanum]|uniref:leucine-rich repeat and transmembrane domain-containing protein 2-like n=1 Tax=Copidosoma floridanum TaxID=29053 RepID=UPI0006C960CD|nr:leucine-rich repeat and transmembrane domain-containing protein 2-like [Copidosoma floridanum]
MIRVLPASVFESLNSLEFLNLQNNRLTNIGEDVIENVIDTLRLIDITDNPLACNCDLQWFSAWLNKLKDKDDEIMSKKRSVCTLMLEHREYPIQKLPLQNMGCPSSYNVERVWSTAHTRISSQCLILFIIYLTTCV